MTLPFLPDPVPEGVIDSEVAYALIAEHGVDHTVAHPACEEIHLKNGAQLTLWYGGDDVPTFWTLEEQAA